jgi:uncharacterized protein with HEPN domain
MECSSIVGMRHVLVHEYFGMDFELIWQVIINDLSTLREKVQIVLSSTK